MPTETKKNQTYTYKGVAYCSACGNCDCPKASPNPFWRSCPAQKR